PDTGSSAMRYNATSDPNGFWFCAARYTSPVNGFGNNGLLISTVATFDASGHDGAASTDSETCGSEHANNPSAAAGFNATPAGSATVVFFTSASPSPSASKLTSWGT